MDPKSVKAESSSPNPRYFWWPRSMIYGYLWRNFHPESHCLPSIVPHLPASNTAMGKSFWNWVFGKNPGTKWWIVRLPLITRGYISTLSSLAISSCRWCRCPVKLNRTRGSRFPLTFYGTNHFLLDNYTHRHSWSFSCAQKLGGFKFWFNHN